MRLLQKDHIKEVMLLSAITLMIMIALMILVNWIQYRTYQEALNQTTKAILAICIEENPQIEDSMMKKLKEIEKIDTKQVEILLQQYGYQEQDMAILEPIQEAFNPNIWINAGIITLLGISFLGIFISYLLKKDHKIEEITQYLQKIQQKDYSLKIEENTEGELSNLRNEIYKITVMLKEETEELVRQKKALSNSLSDISHQLKTPLTSISVMVDVLKENQDMKAEEKEEFLREIARQLSWINWLVISLLKLSKLDAGTIELKKERVNCQALIETVVKNLSIPIEIKNQTVTVTGDDCANFRGDFNWTQEAVLNIVKNCLEHTQEGGTIEVSYQENPLYTEIVIKDNGDGISPEELPHIFQRFYKGKSASKDSVGIGLALAQSIIQKQGGDISVHSQLGEGSQFRIKLYKGIV